MRGASASPTGGARSRSRPPSATSGRAGRAARYRRKGTELGRQVPDDQDPRTGIATRFKEISDIVSQALNGLGVEAHIGETLNFYSLPRQHHKHLKSTNMLERLNEEIKRRTRVVRIFPNPASCMRLVRALCAETHEGWLEDHRYLNMEFLKEQKKELRTAA